VIAIIQIDLAVKPEDHSLDGKGFRKSLPVPVQPDRPRKTQNRIPAAFAAWTPDTESSTKMQREG
jgi:hypothetical protein